MESINELFPSLGYFLGNRHVQAGIAIVTALLTGLVLDFVFRSGGRFLSSRSPAGINSWMLKTIRKPVFTSIMIAGIGVAADLEELPGKADFFLEGTLETILVVVWLYFAIRSSEFLLRWMANHRHRFIVVQPPTLPMFEIGSKVLITGMAVYFLILAWNANPTAWLTSAGIIGIALGFAARDTLANLFAGVSILADAPYKIGDYIVLEGDRGQVTKIGLRSTRILTRDDVEITIPNTTIANSKILNESGGPSPKHRVRVPVGVAYGSNINQVRSLFEVVAMSNQNVCKTPEPRVCFRAFGESSLNFEILCWIDNPMSRGMVLDSLNTELYEALQKAGIEIPFPQRDVHIRQMPMPEAPVGKE